jgi:hypothetical protein
MFGLIARRSVIPLIVLAVSSVLVIAQRGGGHQRYLASV